MPFTVVFIAVVLIVIFYFLSRRQRPVPNPPGVSETESDTYEFAPDDQSLSPVAGRIVRVVAPAQMIGGAKRRLQVIPRPLSGVGEASVPAGKNFALITLVLNPEVQRLDNGDPVSDFPDPLTLTFYYTARDAAATDKNADGSPQLSIISGYLSKNDGWRMERLDTTVTPDPNTGGGTLEAKLDTLYPNDPQWIGRP